MNKVFAEYINSTKNKEGTLRRNLKNIAKNVGLGYSTILHKFR